MTVSIQDVVGAKILVQLGWRGPAAVRGDVQHLDTLKDPAPDLVGHYLARGILDPNRAEKLRKYVDLYERVRHEALYYGLLERAAILSQAELDRYRSKLDVEKYERRLGDILLEEGKISVDQDMQITFQQTQGIVRENQRLLERYRASAFDGVSRPITKNSRARIETGVFTIKNLFRSQESQRLARMAAAAGEAEPRKETADVLPVPRLPIDKQSRATLDLGKALEPARLALPPGVPATVGKFTIESVLGRGGMGMVLLARSADQPEPVAIKLGLSKENEYRARLKREILATSMLSHENIVQVIDAGEAADGSPFLVLEYVRGRELRELLKERGAFSMKDAIAIFVQLLGASGAAHRAGVVHRDLKPENVLVSEIGGRYDAKVMDFGLAKIVEIDPEHESAIYRTQTTDGVSGSPHYLSPEQIMGDAVSPRTDLYALGIILYELLTGVLPYAGDSPGAMIKAHIAKPPRKLAEGKPGVPFPPELDALIASLLAKTPDKRPASADEVLALIDSKIVGAVLAAEGAAAKDPLDDYLSAPAPAPPPPSVSQPSKHGPKGTTQILKKLLDS